MANSTPTLSGDAGHSSLSGYGPSSNAAAVLPVFDGNKKSFRDFDFKLKALCFELGLDVILLRPSEWQASIAALQRRVDGHNVMRGATEQDASSLAKEQSKSRLLAKILITKISANVSRLLQESLREEDHFNAIAIYKFLHQNFSISEEMKQF